MKLLCLHGAYGSAKAFRTQLDPFISQLQETANVQLVFVDGEFETTPPAGFESYFGPPPWYRNINYDGIANVNDMLNSIRSHVEMESYEDNLRHLITHHDANVHGEILLHTLNRIQHLVDSDAEIEGILGYSEGATAAASFLLHERRLQEEQGRPCRLKYGIFFAGWPPCTVQNNKARTILADECPNLIDVPTCHIVGSLDPYLYGSMSLYSVCTERRATLFEHGKGHTVPRDNVTVSELAAAIKTTIAAAA